MQEIADRLTLLRTASGLNQAAWCRLVGIATNTWNQYEKGLNRIQLDQALKLCAATGVTLDWIYRGQTALLPVHLATEMQRLKAARAPSHHTKTRARA